MKQHLVCILVAVSSMLTVTRGAYAGQEQDLVAVLRSNADVQSKCDACRLLKRIGTAESVPALAAWLGDEHLSHAARYALESMGCSEAGAALREALAKTSGDVRIGILDSLGQRRDGEAVPAIAELLRAGDTKTAVAAAAALGHIADAAAVTALQGVGGDAATELRVAVGDGLLNGAELRLKDGDAAGAAAVYDGLLKDTQPSPIQEAAWRGVVLTDRARGVDVVVKALSADGSSFGDAALKLVRELGDQKVLEACMTVWDALPERSQLAVLDGVVAAGDDPLKCVLRAGESSRVAVRVAAWRAMAGMEASVAIPLLANAAAGGEPVEREAAREGLVRLRGTNVRELLLSALVATDGAVAAELLRAVGARGEAGNATVLLEWAAKGEASVRLAALKALAGVPEAVAAKPLLDVWPRLGSEPERAAWRKALATACASGGESAGAVVVDTYIASADPALRAALMSVMNRAPSARTLAIAGEAARGGGGEAALAAVRTLADWPDSRAFDALMSVIKGAGDDGDRRVLALRGCVAVAEREGDLERRLTMLRQVLAAADRVEEKKLALSAIGRVATAPALEAALACLGDAALADEAGAAVVGIGEKLAATRPEAVQAAVGRILAVSKSGAIRSRALALRGGKPAVGPFLREWSVSSPYSQAGVTGAEAVFKIAFAPEKAGGDAVSWRQVPPTDHIDLGGMFPGKVDCAAYLKTRITAPRECEALLLMGSDDGVAAWLNGTLVHANNIDRPDTVDEDVTAIRLKEGANDLLVKVTQGQGGWSFRGRLLKLDGTPFSDLAYAAGDTGGNPAAAVAQAKPATHADAHAKPAAPEPVAAELPARDAFRRLRLSDKFYAEGAYFGDFNRDGKMDVVAGPFWFEGPAFGTRHEYRPVKEYDPKGYSDNFLTYAGDFNGDGWADILCVPFPGKEGYWFENPRGAEGAWPRHLAYDMVGNESPVWGDITGDGRPELLFCNQGFLGYASPDPSHAEAPWAFHAISGKNGKYQRFTHGIGFGDINGDGRPDVLESAGWWEQPKNLDGDTPWPFHAQQFAQAAAQMLVYDVDGDGLTDVICSWHCHQYGLLWYRQTRAADGSIGWEQNVILPPKPDTASSAVRISQLHAQCLADMNGDGLMDIVTGKRFWSHGPTGDVEPGAPAVVLWFELKRDGKGGATYVAHLIDDDSGVGTQVEAVRLDADEHPDVIVANKKGIFVHLSGK